MNSWVFSAVFFSSNIMVCSLWYGSVFDPKNVIGYELSKCFTSSSHLALSCSNGRLSRMWDVMFECHKLQFQIMSIAYTNGNTKISVQSEMRRHITVHLENELSTLSSSFTKWIGAQKSYVQAINGWLWKCVSIPQESTKRKRRTQVPSWKDLGPPIYVTCAVWLEKLGSLPVKEVAESVKSLAAETACFLPHQEKKEGKSGMWKGDNNSDSTVNMLRDEASEDFISSFDHFRSSLVGFLGQLNNFAELSVQMYADLHKAIQDAKNKYAHMRSQM